MSLLVEAEDGLLVDVVRGRDYHRLEPVQLKLDSQRLASIQSQLNIHQYWTNHSLVFINTEPEVSFLIYTRPIIAQFFSKY